jgi:hypothetical protein
MTHGGPRKGAGRKPGPKKPTITVRLSPEAKARLIAYCAAKRTSQAKAIEQWTQTPPQ